MASAFHRSRSCESSRGAPGSPRSSWHLDARMSSTRKWRSAYAMRKRLRKLAVRTVGSERISLSLGRHRGLPSQASEERTLPMILLHVIEEIGT
jgi:hypothetical protein